MAKSIFEILDTLETETSVPAVGRNVSHNIPRSQFPTAEEFESAEKLEAWARETGLMHACLQSGIQKRLIDIRAIFKSEKKGETWSAEIGQKKVNESEWTITERPKTSTAKITTVEDALSVLSKLSPEALAKALADMKANN